MGRADLCGGNSESCRHRDRSFYGRAVDVCERARRSRGRFSARLHHEREGRWILWLALVLRWAESGSAPRREACGTEGKGDCAGCAAAIAFGVTPEDFL